MSDDLLSEVLRMLRADSLLVGDDAKLRQAEIRIRQQFGGGTRYRIKLLPTQGKVHVLAERLAAGASVHEAFAAAGVSRATGFRYLSRRWPR